MEKKNDKYPKSFLILDEKMGNTFAPLSCREYGYMIAYTEDPEKIKRISFYRDRVLWDDSRRCQWAARRLATFDRMVAAKSEEEREKERAFLYFSTYMSKIPCGWCPPGGLCRGCYEYINYN